ncbi:hypothetical protein KI387_033869, partial [Taxus chinensis]
MNTGEEVKLLSGWASPYGLRVQLALKAKGIEYQYVEEDLKNKSELLLNSNPVYKKIPVLIHNGTPICESRIIVEYIDETWPAPPPLLPTHPYDRYLVRFWADFLDHKWVEVMGLVFGSMSAENETVVSNKGHDEYAQMAITMESGVAEMERRGLIYGEGKTRVGYMDVCFASYVALFVPLEELFGLKLPGSEKCPNLQKWMQNLLTNEDVKLTLPDATPAIEEMHSPILGVPQVRVSPHLGSNYYYHDNALRSKEPYFTGSSFDHSMQGIHTIQSEEEVKLLSGSTSPYGIRVQLALQLKGIHYQYVEEDTKNKSQLLLRSNPVYKKIPVLIHNGVPICESRIIIEYIDETWPAPPPLLPNHPYDRYLVRFWADFFDQKFMEAVGLVCSGWSSETKTFMSRKGHDEYAQMAMTLESGIAEMERRGLIYLEGKTCVGYMDFCFAPYVALFGPVEKLFGLRLLGSDKCPNLHKWIQSLLTNEVVKLTLPD